MMWWDKNKWALRRYSSYTCSNEEKYQDQQQTAGITLCPGDYEDCCQLWYSIKSEEDKEVITREGITTDTVCVYRFYNSRNFSDDKFKFKISPESLNTTIIAYFEPKSKTIQNEGVFSRGDLVTIIFDSGSKVYLLVEPPPSTK